MKPITLTFQAFGPYADKVEIDFVRLWKHGVFTITGPNGAGKTTIFDAMVYALYNEIPGYREVSDVRSHFARSSTETVVEFVFEVDGVRWLIRRAPTQMRPKERGEGETERASTVLLRRVDETTGGITKIAAARDEVERLIGLNASQFQQVILIPQGKFEDVLKAETAKRLEILRQLFPVEIYKRFADEVLKDLRDAAKSEFDQLSIRTQGIRESLLRNLQTVLNLITANSETASVLNPQDVEKVSTSIEGLEAATLTIAEVEAACHQISHISEFLAAQREAAHKDATALAEQVRTAEVAARELQTHQQYVAEALDFPVQEKVDQEVELRLQRATKAYAARPLVQQLTKAQRDEQTAARLLPAQEATAKRELPTGLKWPSTVGVAALRKLLTEAASKRDAGASAAQEAERLLDALGGIDAAREESATGLAGITEWTTYLATITEEGKALAAEQKTLKPEIAKLVKCRDKIEQLEVEVAELESSRDLDAVIKELQSVVKARQATEKAAGAAVDRARKALALDAAAHAATLLVAGEPCPTCGSDTHPNPAKSRRTSDESDISALEAAHRNAQEELKTAQTELAQTEGEKRGNKGRTLTVVRTELKEQMKLEQALAKSEERMAEIEERQDAIGVDKDEARENLGLFKEQVAKANAVLNTESAVSKQVEIFVRKQGPVADFDFDDDVWEAFTNSLSTYIDNMDSHVAATKAVKDAKVSLEPVLAGLGVTDASEIETLAQNDTEIAQQRAALNQRAVRRAVVTEAIDAYVRAEKPLELSDHAELQEKSRVAAARHTQISDLVGRLSQTADNITLDRESLEERSEALTQARQAYQEAETLYKVCAGQGGGIATKIKLETWVLAYYLRQVVAQANVRMERLFGGRYQLRVAESAESQQGHYGLELEVFDADTGRYRSVRGMSNGETFKAALALALGLSDVVGMGANRRIDALFIDEGFGALDGPSREAVVDIFDRLQQTGRMVGLITHVESLQQALPQGITVRLGDFEHGGGSSMMVHYPQD